MRHVVYILRKANFTAQVCYGSNHPAEAMPWWMKGEMVNSVDDLQNAAADFWTTVSEFRVA